MQTTQKTQLNLFVPYSYIYEQLESVEDFNILSLEVV